MKIIQILHHSLSPFLKNCDVRFFEEDWHVKVAKEIIKRTNKYDVECWRPERTFKKIYTREKDGIIYKIFPSLYLDFPREYSLSMFRALKKQCKGEDVLIHLQGIHNDLAYLICLLFPNVPIVGSALGGPPYTYSHLGFIRHLPMSLMERMALRNMDKILTGSRHIANELSKLTSGVVLFPAIGVNFDVVKPMDKEKARRSLNLPLNKKIILHVGRFNSEKGLDLILDSYKTLKEEYETELVVIGGQKTEPLYKELIKSGAIVKQRVPHEELIPYYSAADVYLSLRFYPNSRMESRSLFGGMGIATRESLACGTPLVGTDSLKSFIGDEDELKKIGRMPEDFDDVVPCILDVFENLNLYNNCRKIAKKYFDWDSIIRKSITIYDKLFEEYYGRH